MTTAQHALNELAAINFLRAHFTEGTTGETIAAQFHLDTAQGCFDLIHGLTELAYDLAGMLSIDDDSPEGSTPIDVLNGVELGLRTIIGQN